MSDLEDNRHREKE